MRTSALALALALVAAPAAAQDQHDHGAMEHGMAAAEQDAGHCAMMMLGGAPLMGAMHAGPHAILGQREALALTADQVTRLEALQAEMHAGVHGHLEAAKAGHDQAAAVLAAQPLDMAAYEAALKEAAGHVVQAQTTAARVAADTRAVLTAEQAEKLAADHGMHGAMGQGGMMQHGEGGMMQHGQGGMMQQGQGGMMQQGQGGAMQHGQGGMGGMGGMGGGMMMGCPMMQGGGH